MIARYRMVRGERPADDPLPEGTRLNTQHRVKKAPGACFRPAEAMVTAYLGAPKERNSEAWAAFERGYFALIERRFREDPAPFDRIARLARETDVYLGCSCPTARNPDVNHCHTVVALRFMKERYPDLRVRFPPATG